MILAQEAISEGQAVSVDAFATDNIVAQEPTAAEIAALRASLDDPEKRDDMARAMGHMLRRHRSRAFNTWQERAQERAAALAAMKRSVSHMLQRELSRGWLGWLATAAEGKRLLNALRVAAAFGIWHVGGVPPQQAKAPPWGSPPPRGAARCSPGTV